MSSFLCSVVLRFCVWRIARLNKKIEKTSTLMEVVRRKAQLFQREDYYDALDQFREQIVALTMRRDEWSDFSNYWK